MLLPRWEMFPHRCIYDYLLLRLIPLYISLPTQCPGPLCPLQHCPMSYRCNILIKGICIFPTYQFFKAGFKLFSLLYSLEKRELMNQLVFLLLIPLNGLCLFYPANSKHKIENLFTKPRNKTKQNRININYYIIQTKTKRPSKQITGSKYEAQSGRTSRSKLEVFTKVSWIHNNSYTKIYKSEGFIRWLNRKLLHKALGFKFSPQHLAPDVYHSTSYHTSVTPVLREQRQENLKGLVFIQSSKNSSSGFSDRPCLRK